MEANKDINMEQAGNSTASASETLQFAQLYLSTCERLSQLAYEASAKQQQMNMLAQQVTTNSVRSLYAVAAPDAAPHS